MGAWVFGGIAAAGALVLAHSLWRGRSVSLARLLFDYFTGPSAAMALYLATGSWRVAVTTAVVGEVAVRYVRRRLTVATASGGGSGVRTAIPDWANWLMAAIAVTITASDQYAALIVFPYLWLARCLYEFFFADTHELKNRKSALYATSFMLAALIAAAIVVLIAQAAYGNMEEGWFISILILRSNIMILIDIMLYVPIFIWREIKHT